MPVRGMGGGRGRWSRGVCRQGERELGEFELLSRVLLRFFRALFRPPLDVRFRSLGLLSFPAVVEALRFPTCHLSSYRSSFQTSLLACVLSIREFVLSHFLFTLWPSFLYSSLMLIPCDSQYCIYDPRKPADNAQKRPFTRYPSNQRIDDEQTYVPFHLPFLAHLLHPPTLPPDRCADTLGTRNRIKKLETSPTNRYYGLPVEDAPTNTNARRTAGGAGERGGWTARRGYGREVEEDSKAAGGGGGGAVVGGQMGRFQLTSRTGLGGRDEVSALFWLVELRGGLLLGSWGWVEVGRGRMAKECWPLRPWPLVLCYQLLCAAWFDACWLVGHH